MLFFSVDAGAAREQPLQRGRISEQQREKVHREPVGEAAEEERQEVEV